MKRLSAAAHDQLRSRLGAGSGALRFAAAVVAHLAASPHHEARLVERVAGLILACERGSPLDEAAVQLLGEPELLASLFQNADLLDPTEYGAAGAVGALVMETLALATQREDEEDACG